MSEHRCNPWDGCYHASTVRWFHETIPDYRGVGTVYGHFQVLRHMVVGKSADDLESLAYCHSRVVHEGARSASGRWCICLDEEPPSAGEARGTLGSDGFSGMLGVQSDLERAADTLPIAWKTTERVFKAQGRSATYGARFTYYNRNLRVRPIDRWLEPRDDLGRPRSTQLTYYLMALSLDGARTTCRWPRGVYVSEQAA